MRRRGAVREAGQGTMEYVGVVLLVAAVLVALLVTPLPFMIAQSFEKALCAVLGRSNCGGPDQVAQRPHEYYRPELCLVSASGERYGGELGLSIVSVRQDVALVTKQMSDGSVRMTAVDPTKIDVGVAADTGVFIGNYFKIGAEVGVSGEGSYAPGGTWVFDSPQQAERFVENIRHHTERKAIDDSVGSPGTWIYDKFVDTGKVPPPTITVKKYSGKVSASADGGMGLGTKSKRGALFRTLENRVARAGQQKP